MTRRSMIRLLSVILLVFAALMLAATACTVTPPEPTQPTASGPPAAAVPVEAVETGGFVPMSYLVKQSMSGYTASAAGGWWGECLGINTWGVWQSDAWRTDRQIFYLYGGGIDQAVLTIEYGPIAWDGENSVWVYGPTTVLKTANEEASGSAYLLDNSTGDSPLGFSQDETVALEQSRSTTTDKEISVDIGVKTTATIGGDATGAKLEQEVSATLGIKTDVTKAEEESKDTSTTRHIDTEVEPSRAALVTIEKPTITSETPFHMSAAWRPQWIELGASPFESRAPHGANAPSPCAVSIGWPDKPPNDCDTAGECVNHTLRLKWDDWQALTSSTNTDYPHYHNSASDSTIARVQDPQRRWVTMDGTQHREYQNAAKVTVTDVTGLDLDQVVDDHGIDQDHVISGGAS